MDIRSVLPIADPNSRHGPSARQEAQDVLERHGLIVKVTVWQPDRLGDLIRTPASRLRSVVVAGGDATPNAAASGLI